MEFIFEFIKLLDEFYYFKVILIFISFIYLHLPLPLSALIIFNSIYFEDQSFFINLILVNVSYISTYKLIHKFNINKLIERFIYPKLMKKVSVVTKSNEFIKAFFLRFIIPYPILNYFFSITNYSLKHSLIATIISLIPVIYLLSNTSKNLISGNNLEFDFSYLVIYFLYASIIFLIYKIMNKKIKK